MICSPSIGCDMIKIEENYFIKDRHTFHMPVYTKWFVEYETVEELVTLLQMRIYCGNILFFRWEEEAICFL